VDTSHPPTGVVVTGGASGIGLACARALAHIGRPVAVWDLDGDAAHDVAQQLRSDFGVTALGYVVDVREPSEFGDAVEATLGALGTVGAVVHSAGVVSLDPVDALNEAAWARVVDVNLRALALLVPVILPALRASGPGGAIVGIASIEAVVGDGRIPAYCASKAGLLGLVRSLAVGLAPAGIRVNAVCPGYVDTPMTAPAMSSSGARERFARRVPLGRVASPDEIGRVVRFLLSDDASYVTGAELIVDGGLTKTVS
jgi:NAD(P)-dependent dehydrogenase (short-subunit alcohol dehydrogenase family)